MIDSTDIKRWIDRAERDLAITTQVDDYNACYHAQQCVEKMIKVAMLYEGMDMMRGHDLGMLISNLPFGWRY